MPLEEDYFMAAVKQSPKHGHARSKSSVLPTSPPLYRKTAGAAKPAIKGDAEKELSIEQPGVSPTTPKTNLELPTPEFFNKSAEILAQDYMAEMPNSPFKPVGYAHGQDEGYTSDDALSFRKEAFRILDGTVFSEPDTSFDSPRPSFEELTPEKTTTSEKTRKDSPSYLSQALHRNKNKRKEKRRPTPRKADSGYSSGGSFRTGHREASHEGTVPTLTKKPSYAADMLKSGNGSDNEDTASLYTFEQMLALPISKPLPPVPTIENVEYRPEQLHISSQMAMHPTPSSTPISPNTVKSVTSYWTIDSTVSTNQRRLQKRQPSFQELPIVQSCPQPAAGTIPNIPAPVRAKFVRRLSEAPEMECLTETYLSKEHVQAEESVTDAPFPMELEPTPSPTPAPRPRHHRRSPTERR